MRTGFESEAKKMTIKRKWHSRWVKAVTVLASVTVFCTTYALILPAITMSTDTYCGHEEHKHDESCYERQLICVLEEGAEKELEVVTEEVTVVTKEQVLVDAGHTHEEACYETETVLICDIEEVEAKEAVVDEETGEVIEEAVEGHTHTDACYEAVETLVCGEEEREAVYEEQEVETVETVEKEEVREVSGHKHTDECYEAVLKCTIEEHEHEDICFSNKEAVEEPSDWEKTLPEAKEMTKNPSEDIVLVAKTQVGYRESDANFVMVEGQRKGYTRYGAMFGKAYEDWNGMFVQFCMHYAGVNDKYMKGDTDIAKWIKEAQKKEIFFAADAEDFQVKAGDIVFFEKKVDDEKVNTVGIVEEVKEKNIIVIVGDDNNEVVRTKYNVEDKEKEIVGYVILPEKAEEVEEVVIEEKVVETEEVAEEVAAETATEEVAVEETAEEVEEAPVAPNTGIAPEVRLAEATVIASFYTDDTYTEFANEGTAITISGELPVYNTINDDGEEVEDLAVVVKAYKVDAPQINETDAVLAYDITIFYKEGCAPEGSDGTFQPVTPVKVSFESDLLNAETVQGYGIYHIGDDGETEYCGGDNTALEEGVVSFDAHHFSPYMVSIIDSGIQNDSYGAYPEEENEDEEETVIEETFSISSVFQKIRMLSNSSEADNAYATKTTVNGQTTYTVKSWSALEQLIENGKYKDGDAVKTDAGNNLNIVIDGIIAANSGIDAINKTITITGTNDATVYINSTATSIGNQLFWIDKGSFNVTNVTFSGQKATYTPGSGSSNCDLSDSKISSSNGKLKIGGTQLYKVGNGIVAKDSGDFPLSIANSSGAEVTSLTVDNEYYIASLAIEQTDWLKLNDSGNGYDFRSAQTPGDSNRVKWKYNSKGVFENVADSSMIIYRDSSGVSVKKITTIQGCDPASNPSEGTWEPVPNSNINNLVNNSMKGFFIVADEGAQVTLGTGTVIKDMNYTGDSKTVSPIWVNGRGNTHASLIIDGATIQNNKASIPKNDQGNPVTYAVEIIRDVNWNGASRRSGYDKADLLSAGAIYIDNGGSVELTSGTIEGNTGTAGAIYVKGGEFTQTGDNCHILSNHGFKGAVVVDGKDTKGNKVTSLYAFDAGTIDGNDSAVYGAGITAINEGQVVVGDTSKTSRPEIKNNKTLHQGGGIYVHSNEVTLNKALIDNNVAHLMGGGIYVYGGDQNASDSNSVLIIRESYLKDNQAGNNYLQDVGITPGFNDFYSSNYNYGEGGGIWLCRYGSIIMDATKMHMWSNDANGSGKDFFKVARGNGVIVEFTTESDDQFTDTINNTTFGPFPRVDGNVNPKFSPIQGVLALSQSKDYDSALASNGASSVVITNNKAGYAGGGIGANGIVSYKKVKNETIYVPKFSFSKNWKNADGTVMTDTSDESTRFKVRVYDIQNNTNTLVAEYGNHEHTNDCYKKDEDNNLILVCQRQIVLSNGASTNDEYGTSEGFTVNGWNATVALPPIKDEKGNSIYAGLVEKEQTNQEFPNGKVTKTEGDNSGTYDIDSKIRVEIVEVAPDGSEISAYDLELGNLTYTTSTNQITNNQKDIVIDFEHITINTSLTNKYNGSETGLEITKVSDVVMGSGDEAANVPVSGGTTFQIKNFNFGNNGNPMKTPITITLSDNNKFEITNIIEAFKGKGPNGTDLTEQQILDSKFYIQETTTHENKRYEGLQHVIPFKIKKEKGIFKFVPLYKSDISDIAPAPSPAPSDTAAFYKAGADRSVINKTVYVEWEENGTKVKGVDIDTTTAPGSIKYKVTNKMKPIEIKVAKLDENGDPLPGATFKLKTAEGTGNSPLGQTANNPDNGIYTFVNPTSGDKANFLQPGKAYYLWETVAPTGYATLSTGAFIEINEHGIVRLVTDAATITGNSSRYNLTLPDNKTIDPEASANAISNGTISLSDTIDENGVVTINIKNYPKTSIKVKKKWDPSVPNNLQNSVQVDLKANGTVVPGKRITLDSNSDPNLDWSGEWTDLPKYESHTHGDSCYDGDTLTCTKEALTLIDYTVEEVAGANNQFKVEYDFTDETVTSNCSNTGASTITGWQDVGIANLRGKSFRIVSNGKAYYVDDSGALQTISTSNANVSDYYSKMLWTTRAYEHPSYYVYRVAFKHTAADGKDYHIAATNDYDRLTVRQDVHLLFYYDSYYKYMYWYDYNVAKYVDGTKTGNTYSNTVKFQVPIYENSQVCTDQINPREWTITNSYDTLDLDFKKAWNDAGHESERPAYIDVELWVNNRKFEGKDLRVYGPNWTGKWENLPKYVDGVEAEYTVKEVTLNDHYTPTITTSTATGREIIGWRKISHTALEDPAQQFRIVVNGKAYYLAADNTLKSTSKNSSSLYERMLWTAPYYNPTNVYYGTVYEVDIKLQSAYNPLYFIYNKPSADNNEAGTLLASTNASTYTYYVNANSIYYWVHNYTYGQWQYGFSGEVDPRCSAQVTFEEPIYGGTGNTELTITNTYHEHTGLELVKVDESGKSNQWVEEEGKQAQFTIYHMKGEIAPKTLTIENGKIFLDPIPTELIPKSGNSYFFIVETRTPTQANKPAYAKLETAIPIRISSSGEAYLITSASELNGTWFQNNYNSTTEILAAAGTGDNARPAIKVAFGQVGDGKMVSASKDQKRITITAKNTPIDNEIELLKIDSLTSKPLGGATFVITKSGGGNVQNPATGNGNWTTADGTGILKVEDLAPGTYIIKESVAAEGHQPDTNTTVTVVVDEYGKITATTNNDSVVTDIKVETTQAGTIRLTFKFKNTPISYELPETGGIGTTVFALIGTILIMVAAVLLAVRRRLAREIR